MERGFSHPLGLAEGLTNKMVFHSSVALLFHRYSVTGPLPYVTMAKSMVVPHRISALSLALVGGDSMQLINRMDHHWPGPHITPLPSNPQREAGTTTAMIEIDRLCTHKEIIGKSLGRHHFRTGLL